MREYKRITTSILTVALLSAFGCNPPPKKHETVDLPEKSPPVQVKKAPATGEVKPVNIPPKPKPKAIEAPPDVAAPPADAEVTESGLASKVLQAGNGTEKPTPEHGVRVHYTGWTTDGKMFDSSVVRGEPVGFSVTGVIKGWTEGLQLMVVGEKRRLWIPESLAYMGKPNYPKGMLVFDVELLSIHPKPETPADVAAPPADAEKSESGLAWKVVKEGTGTVHPKATDRVEVHYTGWMTDGKMFDSSVMKGKPAAFPLHRVIAGWTEGVQLMVEGEKRIFWIPEDLAYQGKPGKPPGMLVFEIELLGIK